MFDTLDTLVGKVQKRVGQLPDYYLVQEWLVAALRDVGKRHEWSWRRAKGEFTFYAAYSTGTVTINRGENTATFSGSVLTNDYVGMQLRAGGNVTPIKTIIGLISSTVAVLDSNWSGASLSAATFEIYQAYVTVPDDFAFFAAVVDLDRGFQLDFWTMTGDDFDRVDPRRTYGGNLAYYISLRDNASVADGSVGTLLAAKATGSTPLAGGSYTGLSDATFFVEMTAAAVFKWRKNNGTYVTAVAVDPAGNAQELQEGVLITFPTSGTYTSGDAFAIPVTASFAPGSPRFEPWPHIKAAECRPYVYMRRMPDLTDAGAALPRFVDGEVLVEMALEACANWPGSEERKNPYYNLKLAMMHHERAERLLDVMDREDQSRAATDVTYADWTSLPIGMLDSAYLANHDVGFEIDVL